MKYLFFFVHPSKFHLFRITINNLLSKGHDVDILITSKDVLEDLVKAEGWRYPKLFPLETHHQAQGIITFSRLSSINEDYLSFAQLLIKNAINNLQNKTGYFYFRKYKNFTNKISLMRWSQAFMMLALTEFLRIKVVDK